MKRLIVIACIVLIWAGLTSAKDLKTYRATYEKKLDEIILFHGMKMTELGQQYTKSLDALLAKVKKDGDLDKTLAVNNEIQRYNKEKAMPGKPSAIPVIGKMHASYARPAAFLETDKAKKIISLVSSYDKALEQYQKELVSSDELNDAVAVQKERKELDSDQSVIAARATLLDDAKQSVETRGQVKRIPKPTPAAEQKYKWSFDGLTLNACEMEDGGSFLESKGKVAVKAYTLGKGWHGPKASIPVSLEGDFQLGTKLNYRTRGREIGRLAVGVRLESGEVYTIAMQDDHVSIIGHNITFSCNAGIMWATGRKPSKKRFSKYPLMIHRHGDILTFLVKGVRKGSHKDCDTSKVEEVFFTIQQYSSYPALTEASINEIYLLPMGK